MDNPLDAMVHHAPSPAMLLLPAESLWTWNCDTEVIMALSMLNRSTKCVWAPRCYWWLILMLFRRFAWILVLNYIILFFDLLLFVDINSMIPVPMLSINSPDGGAGMFAMLEGRKHWLKIMLKLSSTIPLWRASWTKRIWVTSHPFAKVGRQLPLDVRCLNFER